MGVHACIRVRFDGVDRARVGRNPCRRKIKRLQNHFQTYNTRGSKNIWTYNFRIRATGIPYVRNNTQYKKGVTQLQVVFACYFQRYGSPLLRYVRTYVRTYVRSTTFFGVYFLPFNTRVGGCHGKVRIGHTVDPRIKPSYPSLFFGKLAVENSCINQIWW